MPYSETVTADKAMKSALDNQRLMNDSRYKPPMLEAISEASEKTRIFIFNVGPWQQQRLMGSLGTYNIPACPPDKEYSAPVVIPGIVSELYPINEGEFKRTMEDGMQIAQQVLGVGPFQHPRNSLVSVGVFISKMNPPSKEDILAAKKELYGTFRQLVQEADAAFARGPKAIEETIRAESHFTAARALKKSVAECPWLRNSELPAERQNCAGCGAIYNVGILKCSCGFVLDKARYDQAVKMGLYT